MSCSGLALWLKRLTEINMFLCSRFLKKKRRATSAESSRRENGEKIGFGMTVFAKYSGVLPSEEEILTCRAGVISREANTYSLPETLAGREPSLPNVWAQRQPDLCRESPGQCARAEFIPPAPGSTRCRSKLCTRMDQERPLLFCCHFLLSDFFRFPFF